MVSFKCFKYINLYSAIFQVLSVQTNCPDQREGTLQCKAEFHSKRLARYHGLHDKYEERIIEGHFTTKEAAGSFT